MFKKKPKLSKQLLITKLMWITWTLMVGQLSIMQLIMETLNQHRSWFKAGLMWTVTQISKKLHYILLLITITSRLFNYFLQIELRSNGWMNRSVHLFITPAKKVTLKVLPYCLLMRQTFMLLILDNGLLFIMLLTMVIEKFAIIYLNGRPIEIF